MKKPILALLVTVSVLFGCKKDEPCNCGTIVSDGINGNCYYLEIRNECSGNKKTFCFDYDTWFEANPGEHFCVTNEGEW